MKDAHLRLGLLEYERHTEKISTRIRVRVSQYIGEDADAHLLSVFGNDSDVGAITAAIYDQGQFRLTFPDGQAQEISLGERATCYRGGVTIPGRKHGVRHMVALSEEIRGLRSPDRTYSLSESPDVVWSAIVRRLGIPAVPEWAGRMMELFKEKKRIRIPDCIGYRALLVTATGGEVLEWLEELIVQDELHLPERNGPIVWPQISIQSLMKLPLVAG